MRISALILCAILGAMFLGCASEPVKPIDGNERIMVFGDLMSKTYQQKGEEYSKSEIRNYLMNNEKTNAKVRKSRTWSNFVMPLAAAGVGLGISSVLSNADTNSTRDAKLGIGVGLVGLAVLASYYSNENLDEAVNIYNEKFPPLPPPEIEPSEGPEGEEEKAESSRFFNFDLIPDTQKFDFAVLGGWRYRF